ncbi:MAG TPA: circadian clock KaiB family protein [Candidatus Omnitrophota bacterium]|nr:circadian clock KaiB family protein [Candidatus Omnitrophota bacterium]
MKKRDHIEKKLEKSIRNKNAKKYILHLYVAGLSPASQKAIENIKKICEEYIKGKYDLVIQDIYQKPIVAKEGQILAAPTLVKKFPLPIKKFIGDMTNKEVLIVGLNLKSNDAQKKPKNKN